MTGDGAWENWINEARRNYLGIALGAPQSKDPDVDGLVLPVPSKSICDQMMVLILVSACCQVWTHCESTFRLIGMDAPWD